MKNGLAAILEVVRVFSESGCDFPGEILVTAYGLHEAPKGNSAGLLNLIKRTIKGDAALVAETGHAAEGAIVTQGKGQSVWNVTIKRSGSVCHELNYPVDAPDFFTACMTVAKALTDQGKKLSAGKSGYDLLSSESLFVGQMHYGDFYNRVPATCTMQGTRRWHPDKIFADITREMDGLLETIRLPAGITVSCEWLFVGESYAVDKNETVVLAQQRAFQAVTGKTAEYQGLSVVADTSRLVPLGNVPTVLCGFDNEFAHADYEYVRLDRLLEPCRIMLMTALNYLTMAR
jgi:acetylornithine deacetylase/succinyl-diaminopimelate desuccinylase-like protein